MTRILTGVVGILIMIPICIFSGTAVWPIVVTILSVIAVGEMLRCIGVSKEKPFCQIAYAFALLPILSWLLTECFSLMDPFRCLFFFSALFVLSEMIASLFTENRMHSEKLYSLIALMLYVVVSLTAISQIRFIDHGNQEGKYIYLLVFVGAWCSDTFAYFVGKSIGKHKLCPIISPKKTVEGSIGGILGNMIAFAGYALILRKFFHFSASVFIFAVLGALFSVVGQFGDLFASAIKRHYNIKDYGKLFPGHGGVLDRFDSTLAIALVMLMVYAAFGSRFLIG